MQWICRKSQYLKNVWEICLQFVVYMDLFMEEMRNGGICVSYVE
jgi:hypothetical protein